MDLVKDQAFRSRRPLLLDHLHLMFRIIPIQVEMMMDLPETNLPSSVEPVQALLNTLQYRIGGL